MKLELDLARSLELCPPEKIYSKNKGVKFIKRVVLNRNKVKFNKQFQTYRVEVNLRQNITDLKKSYSVFGFLHDKPPQVISVSKTNSKFYDGDVGHNRDEAQEENGIETAIYDIVDYTSPLAKLEFAYQSNHHAPAAGSKDEDILKGLSKAHDSGWTNLKDDKELKKLISVIAGDTEEKDRIRIFKKYRATKSKYDSIQPYDGTSANAKAETLGLPIKGDYSYEQEDNDVSEYGYVKDPGGYKTLLHDGLKTWLANDANIEINVTGYVHNPTPENLKDKRVSYINELVSMKNFLINVCHEMTGVEKNEIKKLNKYPFKFKGFLPQNITPDVTNGGLAVEGGLVDENGKTIE
tara:strand:+ start:133 stop:1185 length:1053 start_codon:yes stop_codon:yes gene_type:complete